MMAMKQVTEIWKNNAVHEFNTISRSIAACRYISVDTEFPGFIRRTPFRASDEQRYRDLKLNVDSMKIVQLGFTLYDGKGRALGPSWQVSFKEFAPESDSHAAESIELLKSSGIDFDRNRRDGVDAYSFSDLLLRNVIRPCRRGGARWVTFHGLYDLAYIIKLLLPIPLPETLPEFMALVDRHLGVVLDVKCIAKSCGISERVGLIKMAEELGLVPEGQHHQAGHDSKLIGEVFEKLKDRFRFNEDKFVGVVYGVSSCSRVPLRRNNADHMTMPVAPPRYVAPQIHFVPVFAYPPPPPQRLFGAALACHNPWSYGR